MGADGRRSGGTGNRVRRKRGVAREQSAAAKLEALEAVCTALAHPARRQILLAVQFCGGEANAGYIAQRFSCSWPTVSRHLGVLEKAGLLIPERQGRERIYRMNKDALDVLNGWLAWFEKPPV